MEDGEDILKQRPKRYLLVIKNLVFLYSHFWPIASAIQDAGWELWIAADPNADPQRILDAGMKFTPLYAVSGFRHVFLELRSIAGLNAVLRKVKPDVVHFIYLKNVLTGGILARLNRTPAVIGAITGLGSLFAEDRLDYRLIRRIVIAGLKFGFQSRRSLIAFENADDQEYFVRRRAVRPEQSCIIPGAGVDRKAIAYQPWQAESPIILCASRMIRNKGILELIDAHGELRRRGVNCELWLAGGVDEGNPTTLTEQELRSAEREGMVKWLGHRSDIHCLLRETSVFCLPTYYREGLPKVLVEAGAAGRPTVTTNVPGCREIIKHGVNGLLVPPRDVTALANALEDLLLHRDVCVEMGIAARRIFEDRFTLDAVLDSFSYCYRILDVPLKLKSSQQKIPPGPPTKCSVS